MVTPFIETAAIAILLIDQLDAEVEPSRTPIRVDSCPFVVEPIVIEATYMVLP